MLKMIKMFKKFKNNTTYNATPQEEKPKSGPTPQEIIENNLVLSDVGECGTLWVRQCTLCLKEGACVQLYDKFYNKLENPFGYRTVYCVACYEYLKILKRLPDIQRFFSPPPYDRLYPYDHLYNSLFDVNGLIEVYHFQYQIYSYEDAHRCYGIYSYEDAHRCYRDVCEAYRKALNFAYREALNFNYIPLRAPLPKPENTQFKDIQFKGYYNNNTKWFEGECKYYNVFSGSLQYITIFQNDDDTKPKVQHIYIKK